jgi:hypothetical protein
MASTSVVVQQDKKVILKIWLFNDFVISVELLTAFCGLSCTTGVMCDNIYGL